MTLPEKMTAIAITRAGGPDVLVPESRPVPRPGPNQVLIRVRAAGVNRHDCGQRARGTPPPGATDIPGLECAGEVAAFGAAVSGVKEGDRVCALVNGGGYAEYCLADSPLVMPTPTAFDDLDAASIPEAAFTTWLNLVVLCDLKPGEWLLIHGGASGVGTFAIQMARAWGVRVIATAGGDDKVAACAKLGANVVCNYRTEDFVKVVERATGGRGVDVILDMAGGAYAERNLAALAADGRITHLTSNNAPDYATPLSAIMQKRARVTGALLRGYPLEKKRPMAVALRERIWPLLGSAIKPVRDTVFPLADARKAHERIESGAHIGKILLTT
jgi:NADPH:quinone reductase